MYRETMHIAKFMAERGLSDEDMAQAIGVARATINRIRRGKERPRWRNIEKIQRFSGGVVSADDFAVTLQAAE